ncbi:MAG: hypothetical protein K2Y32_00040 [Candidatus Obscuribacterales bacterium]|nr:hypothetical protein [Candidatus Obscuribacterales bacterium]
MDKLYANFSNRASAAIAEALFCAHTAGSKELDEADILYGLAKVSPQIYGFLVSNSVIEGPVPVTATHSRSSILQQRLELTNSAENVIEKAHELCRAANEEKVSTLHLFLALILSSTTLNSYAFQKLKSNIPAVKAVLSDYSEEQDYSFAELPREVQLIALLKVAKKHPNWRKELRHYLSQAGISEQEIALRLL